MRGAIWLLFAACGTKDPSGGTDTHMDDTDTDTDTDSDSDTDTDVDTDIPTPVTGCYDVPMVVTGGFGLTGEPFVPAGAGAIAQLVHGPQGGWHVETSVRVESVHEIIGLTPTITLVSTGQMISGLTGDADVNHATVFLVLDGECSGVLTGQRAILDDVDPDPKVVENVVTHICGLDGAEVDVGYEVTDLTDFRTGSATVRATLALDPIDVVDCSPN